MRAMLDSMKIPHATLPDYMEGDGGAAEILEEAIRTAKTSNQPYAILVKRQTFLEYNSSSVPLDDKLMSREDALRMMIQCLGKKDVVVGTTGFASREIYTIRDELQQGHAQDFLTVGSMGHASIIALGVAQNSPQKNVVCFDGDGAMLMHMGNMATIAKDGTANLKHVIFNNGVHDSVGAQQTTLKEGTSIAGIADTLGYSWTKTVKDQHSILSGFMELLKAEGPALLEVYTNPGARSTLGRPRERPQANKTALMEYLGAVQ